MSDSPRPGRLWVDMTNSPHVLVLRPVIAEFERRGWDVVVTAREFAQTLPLLERFGIPHTVISRHRGRSMFAKAFGLLVRASQMIAFGRGRDIDLALSHASNDLPVAAKWLGIPHVTMFDYEFAKLSHSVNVRLSVKALVPDAIQPEALAPYGGERKWDGYPGLKEEYYLADMNPDVSVLEDLGLDRGKVIVVLRTPPSMAAYHRMDNPLFTEILETIAARPDVQAVVLARTPDQVEGVRAVGGDNIVVPDEVVDAQSLVYFADLVISGGGTLNREAAALGTPAYTVFQGEMGAVDAVLVDTGRLRHVSSGSEIRFEKKHHGAERVRRPVGDLVDRILAAEAVVAAIEKHVVRD